jgi:hypothetical protein
VKHPAFYTYAVWWGYCASSRTSLTAAIGLSAFRTWHMVSYKQASAQVTALQ